MNRRRFIKLGLIGTGVCVAGGLSRLLFPTKNITFEQAQKNPSLRDNYLEQIIEKHGKPKSVADISYATLKQLQEETGVILQETDHMFTHINGSLSQIGTRTLRPYVYVLPHSFETKDIQHEVDFVNTLVDHEFFHANTCYSGFGVISMDDLQVERGEQEGLCNTDLFRCAYELLAYENQEKEARRKPVSKANGTRILNNYCFNYFKLWDFEKDYPNLTTKLKREFFKDWMRQSIKRDSKGFYLENTKTKRRFYLDKKLL